MASRETEDGPYAHSGAGSKRRAIGLMSGTSMDGIDVAGLVTDGEGTIERGPAREYPYDLAQRRRLEDAVAEGRGAHEPQSLRSALASLERALTDWHVAAVERFERETGFEAELIGLHGHTVAHRPDRGWSVQLGDGARMARALDRPVVFDFRANDLAAGGEGAPLVPVYHQGLLGHGHGSSDPICFLNVGGVANVTIVDGGELSAFDCGPGNMLLDRWMQREVGVPFDAGGRIASEGRVARDYVDEVLVRPFFARAGPRSLDRLDFDLPPPGRFEAADGARTLTHLTAAAVCAALAPLERPPKLVIVCGGGRSNDLLMRDLRDVLEARVEPAETFGYDGGAMEAEAFAYLAVRAVRGLPSTFPATTGVRVPTVAGRLARP